MTGTVILDLQNGWREGLHQSFVHAFGAGRGGHICHARSIERLLSLANTTRIPAPYRRGETCPARFTDESIDQLQNRRIIVSCQAAYVGYQEPGNPVWPESEKSDENLGPCRLHWSERGG